jgi:hypothetical protein
MRATATFTLFQEQIVGTNEEKRVDQQLRTKCEQANLISLGKSVTVFRKTSASLRGDALFSE